MATVIGIVALILAVIAGGTSAILGTILQQNLDNKVQGATTFVLQSLPRPSITNDGMLAYHTLDGSPKRTAPSRRTRYYPRSVTTPPWPRPASRPPERPGSRRPLGPA